MKRSNYSDDILDAVGEKQTQNKTRKTKHTARKVPLPKRKFVRPLDKNAADYETDIAKYNEEHYKWIKECCELEKDIPLEERTRDSLERECRRRLIKHSGSKSDLMARIHDFETGKPVMFSTAHGAKVEAKPAFSAHDVRPLFVPGSEREATLLDLPTPILQMIFSYNATKWEHNKFWYGCNIVQLWKDWKSLRLVCKETNFSATNAAEAYLKNAPFGEKHHSVRVFAVWFALKKENDRFNSTSTTGRSMFEKLRRFVCIGPMHNYKIPSELKENNEAHVGIIDFVLEKALDLYGSPNGIHQEIRRRAATKIEKEKKAQKKEERFQSRVQEFSEFAVENYCLPKCNFTKLGGVMMHLDIITETLDSFYELCGRSSPFILRSQHIMDCFTGKQQYPNDFNYFFPHVIPGCYPLAEAFRTLLYNHKRIRQQRNEQEPVLYEYVTQRCAQLLKDSFIPPGQFLTPGSIVFRGVQYETHESIYKCVSDLYAEVLDAEEKLALQRRSDPTKLLFGF